MPWVVSQHSSPAPRVVILELTDPTACPLIFDDITRIVSTASEAQWS
jgi:hypothetical protein